MRYRRSFRGRGGRSRYTSRRRRGARRLRVPRVQRIGYRF